MEEDGEKNLLDWENVRAQRRGQKARLFGHHKKGQCDWIKENEGIPGGAGDEGLGMKSLTSLKHGKKFGRYPKNDTFPLKNFK